MTMEVLSSSYVNYKGISQRKYFLSFYRLLTSTFLAIVDEARRDTFKTILPCFVKTAQKFDKEPFSNMTACKPPSDPKS